MFKLAFTVLVVLTIISQSNARVPLELPQSSQQMILGQKSYLNQQEFSQKVSILLQTLADRDLLSKKDINMAKNFTQEYIKKQFNSDILTARDVEQFVSQDSQGFSSYFETNKDAMIIKMIQILGIDQGKEATLQFIKNPDYYGLFWESYVLLSYNA